MLPASLAFARAAATDAAARTSSSGLRPASVQQQPPHGPTPAGRRRSFSTTGAGPPASTPPAGAGEWGGFSATGPAPSSSAAAVRRLSLDAGGVAARRASLEAARRPAAGETAEWAEGGRAPIPFDVPAFLPNVSLKFGCAEEANNVSVPVGGLDGRRRG